MQALRQNIKTGLITLGVIVALLAVLLTPGFFHLGAVADDYQPRVSEPRESVTESALDELAKHSAESFRDLMKKASVR